MSHIGTSTTRRYAAIDLGASSGRVILGEISSAGIRLREMHRFANRPVQLGGTLHWDVLALWADIVEGLRIAGARCNGLDGIGVDSWAIDYALLDADGRLLTNPVHYRDARTEGVAERVAESIAPAELYRRTGVQVLPFNTIFQLVAARDTWAMQHAERALLIPDLFSYWLTGELGSELTNASTTGLLDARSHVWSREVAQRVGIRADLFPAIRQPGSRVGTLLDDVAERAEVTHVPVISVASHDTASAVLAVPAADESFAYISCGTWSLVGIEIDAPITTDAARTANFSNELGVDRTVRFLRNVMGLWLLQECMRSWSRAGHDLELEELLDQAAEEPGGRSVIDPDRPEFLPPGDMPRRLQEECRRTDQVVPRTPAEITRCILDSLAAAYRTTVHEAARLSGRTVAVVHLVGGGAQNSLLCQLTADACELPVVAGPVEAAAYGNVVVQARSLGSLGGDRWELRQLIRGNIELTRYEPRTATRGRGH